MVIQHDFVKFPELTNRQMEEFQFNSPHPQILEDFNAKVVRVHDGDTISLSTSFRDFVFPLRFLDIDAPELNEGGKEAGNWLRSKILDKQIEIKIDRNKRVGKYGRLLGQVFHNGMDVGQEEINLGLAVQFGKKNEGEPDSVEKMFSLKQWL